MLQRLNGGSKLFSLHILIAQQTVHVRRGNRILCQHLFQLLNRGFVFASKHGVFGLLQHAARFWGDGIAQKISRNCWHIGDGIRGAGTFCAGASPANKHAPDKTIQSLRNQDLKHIDAPQAAD